MLIKNAKIIYLDKIEKGSVKISDGKIVELNPENHEDDSIIDARGMYLSPGFIDIHIHGAAGKDTMDGKEADLNIIAEAIAKYGTTSFVPTTMTMDIPSIHKAVSAAANAKKKGTRGANVLGVHLEGPFINEVMMRAQNPEFILEPSIESYETMTAGYEDSVLAVTLAPEMPGSEKLIRYLCGKGIKVSMGHTNADYEAAMKGIEAGVSHATHLYNAMTPLRHRGPGVVGAVFDSGITTEILADGIHVAYPAIRLALKQKGIDHTILVSDAMMGCTMPEGEYMLGGQVVYLYNGVARLKDGTMAGTLLTLNEAVGNLKNNTDYPLYELVRMAAYNPAVYCGVQSRKGKIEAGYDADVILFDEDVMVRKVVIGGKLLAAE